MDELNQVKQTDKFLNDIYTKALIPSILSIMGGCVNIIVDGILVGQKIGENGLAAISMCVPMYLVICIFGSFFVTGAAISATTAVGRVQPELAQKYYESANLICLFLSIIFTLVGIFASATIARLFTTDSELLIYVLQYTMVTLIGAAPRFFIYIPFNFLRIDGKNKSCMNMVLIMAVINIILDVVFLYVFNLGVAGASLASVLATAVACVIGYRAIHNGDSTFTLRLSFPTLVMLKEMSVAGSPAAVNNLMQMIRTLFINSALMMAGGVNAVAIFSVVNGVSAFAESITLGVPQAGQAIIGVCQGEHDISSQRILLNRQGKMGMAFVVAFGALITLGNGVIGKIYGVESSIFIPMLMLALSMIPALFNNIMSTYYTLSNKSFWANAIIVCKTFIFTIASLWVLMAFNITPWLFLLLSEGLTTLVWAIATGLVWPKLHPEVSPYLMIDKGLMEEQVYNFSVEGDAAKATRASVIISDFCDESGMAQALCMKISLALEEIFVYIIDQNPETKVNFDIRVFKAGSGIGIRIRYNGIRLNPLGKEEEDEEATSAPSNPDDDSLKYPDEDLIGIMIIKNITKECFYETVFGVNTMAMFF